MYVGMKLEYSMNPLSVSEFDAYRFSGYDKPWTRCIPYLMGLAAAMMFHRVGSKIRLNRCYVIGGYATSLVLFIAVVIVVPANYFGGVEKVPTLDHNESFDRSSFFLRQLSFHTEVAKKTTTKMFIQLSGQKR